MFTLIALGVGVAWTYQRRRDGRAEPLSAARHDGQAGPPVYFEASAVITTLVLVGQVLELVARDRTGDAIRAFSPRAEAGLRIDPDASEREVALEDIASATRCACGRARRSPSTARSSKAPAPSTSR